VPTSRQFLPEPLNASIKKLLSGSNLAIENVLYIVNFVNTHDLVAAGTDALSRPYLRQMRWLEPDFAPNTFLDLAVPGQRLWPACPWARHGKDTANYHLVQVRFYFAKMRKCLYYSHHALSLRFSEVETEAFETMMIKLYKTIQNGKFVMELNYVTGTSFLKNPQSHIGMIALGFKKSTEICG